MPYSLRFIFIAIVVFSLSSCWNMEKEPITETIVETVNDDAALEKLPDYQEWIDTTCETGYLVLDIESWAGLPVTYYEYNLLDELLDDAEKKIPKKEQYTRREALDILIFISDLLQNKRLQQVSYHSAFYMCLRYRLFDCDINSLLFLTIADRFDLPIYGLVMPAHMCVLWDDGKHKIYWETTANRTVSMEYYIEKFKLDTTSINKNIFLSPLNQEQIKALTFYNIGNTYRDINSLQLAALYTRYAVDIYPNWVEPYINLARIYNQLKEPEIALYYCNRSLERLPNLFEIYEMQGIAYTELGCNTEAIEAYQQYLQQIPPKRKYDYKRIAQDIRKRMEELDV